VREISVGKTKIAIYGGLGTVGGNCIVVKSPSSKIMLDQGINFQQLRRFYGAAVQPDSVEELREMGVLPPREAYSGVEEVYLTHLHLDHAGSLNVPGGVPTYLPSVEVAEALSHSWWYGWKQQLLPPTLSFREFREVGESRRLRAAQVSHSAYPSYAFRVDADDASILYTGDLRVVPLHRVGGDTLRNLEELSEGGVDVLVVEGTNFARRFHYLGVAEFESLLKKMLDSYDRRLLFVSTHLADLESFLAVAEVLWRYGYAVVLVKDYHAQVVDRMISLAGYEPEGELVLAPSRAAVKHIPRKIGVVAFEDLRDRRCAVAIPPYAVKEIKRVASRLGEGTRGLLHVLVVSETAEEEWVFEEKKVESWVEVLGVTGYRLHVSGHYHPHEFGEVVRVARPKRLVPVHTRTPETLLALFEKYAQP